MEIVEGPGVGRLLEVTHSVVIGRDPDVDLTLEDAQASRHHARLLPTATGAVVEDLGSTNGTLLNHNEVHGRQRVAAGDELIVGVTVLQARSADQAARHPTAVRPIPPPLAAARTEPRYVERRGPAGVPELDRLRDRRTKSKATLAPLAIFVLVALAVIIYLGLS